MLSHHTHAVGADEGGACGVADLGDLSFPLGSLLAVLLESGGEDDDRLAGLLVAEGLHCGQTHLRGDGEDGAVHGGKQLYVPVGLDSLGRVALGVDDVQLSGIVSVQKILEGGSTRLVDIVRTSDDHNAFRRD